MDVHIAISVSFSKPRWKMRKLLGFKKIVLPKRSRENTLEQSSSRIIHFDRWSHAVLCFISIIHTFIRSHSKTRMQNFHLFHSQLTLYATAETKAYSRIYVPWRDWAGQKGKRVNCESKKNRFPNKKKKKKKEENNRKWKFLPFLLSVE